MCRDIDQHATTVTCSSFNVCPVTILVDLMNYMYAFKVHLQETVIITRTSIMVFGIPDLDPCGHRQPCGNNATCINTGADLYQCVCTEQYEGENCTLNRTDECSPNPCQNEGQCSVRDL